MRPTRRPTVSVCGYDQWRVGVVLGEKTETMPHIAAAAAAVGSSEEEEEGKGEKQTRDDEIDIIRRGAAPSILQRNLCSFTRCSDSKLLINVERIPNRNILYDYSISFSSLVSNESPSSIKGKKGVEDDLRQCITCTI